MVREITETQYSDLENIVFANQTVDKYLFNEIEKLYIKLIDKGGEDTLCKVGLDDLLLSFNSFLNEIEIENEYVREYIFKISNYMDIPYNRAVEHLVFRLGNSVEIYKKMEEYCFNKFCR